MNESKALIMSELRSTLRNAAWLVSDRLLRLVLNFFAVALIIRAVGPEQFGMLAYGQAITLLMTPIATIGLQDILVRELSRRAGGDFEDERQTIISSALFIRIVMSVFAIFITAIIALVTEPNDDLAKAIVIICSIAFVPQSLDVVESGLQSVGSFKTVSIIRAINSTIFAAIRVVLVMFSPDIWWFAVMYPAEIAVFAVFYMILAKVHGLNLNLGSVRYISVVALITDALPLMLRLLAISIYMRIDQVMIKSILGSESLGVYSAATRISEIWYFVPTALMSAVLPRLTKAFEIGIDEYNSELAYWLRIMMAIAVPSSIVLSFSSEFIVELLFGIEFHEASGVLAIQAWAGVFVALGVAAGPWFVNTGQLRFGLYQTIIGAITSIILNAVLIPIWGLSGGAISMVVSYAVSGFLCNYIFKETRSLFFMQARALIFRS